MLVSSKRTLVPLLLAFFLGLSACGGGSGGSSGGGGGSGGTGGGGGPTDNVVIEFANAGGAFYVDDGTVRLRIGEATRAGTAVTAQSLRLVSDIDGAIAATLALNSDIDITLSSGTHQLTLSGEFAGGTTGSTAIEVIVLPRRPQIPAGMKQAAGSRVKVPVVLVTYLPTKDGTTLDTDIASYTVRPWGGNGLSNVYAWIETLFVRKTFMLTEMSRFRGYKNSADPYLGYEVVDHIVIYGAFPTIPYPPDTSRRIFDYAGVMDQIGGKTLVEDEGVKEIWLSTYYAGDDVILWESNMASLATGDISNSDRRNTDLPVYEKTYVVYGMNYHRTQAEAVHNHGHQIEAMLDYLDLRDNGQRDIFWHSYVGAPNFPSSVTLDQTACGWTHTPPYTNDNYGYLSAGETQSSCEDWRPDGSGARKAISGAYIQALGYAWPSGTPPQHRESNFYIWWGQNMPGLDNSIPYNGTTMANWWQLMNNWDESVASGTRLYR